MGQTDGRTPDSYADPVPHTMRAVPVIRCCFCADRVYCRDAAGFGLLNVAPAHNLLRVAGRRMQHQMRDNPRQAVQPLDPTTDDGYLSRNAGLPVDRASMKRFPRGGGGGGGAIGRDKTLQFLKDTGRDNQSNSAD